MFDFTRSEVQYMDSKHNIYRNKSKYIAALKMFLLLHEDILFCLNLWFSGMEEARDSGLNWFILIDTFTCGILEIRSCRAMTAISRGRAKASLWLLFGVYIAKYFYFFSLFIRYSASHIYMCSDLTSTCCHDSTEQKWNLLFYEVRVPKWYRCRLGRTLLLLLVYGSQGKTLSLY